MVSKIEFSGKTIDAALEKAAAELKMDRDDLSYEVLQLPKRGFLGMGSMDAKIAVKLGEPDEEIPAAKPAAPRPAPRPEVNSTGANLNAARPAVPKNMDQKPAEAKSAPQRASEPPRPQRQDNRPPRAQQPHQQQQRTAAASSAPRTDSRPIPTPVPAAIPVKPAGVPAVVDNPDSAKGKAIIFLQTLIKNMEINAQVELINEQKDELDLAITGESLGLLIGHHGEILDSIQYLTNLAANKADDDYLKITVDIENYRAKREVTLRALALRMADKVKRFKKNITLEPMNSYERRIIHSVIQDIPGVTTYSVGVDTDRKIVVALERPGREKNPDAGKPRAPRPAAATVPENADDSSL